MHEHLTSPEFHELPERVRTHYLQVLQLAKDLGNEGLFYLMGTEEIARELNLDPQDLERSLRTLERIGFTKAIWMLPAFASEAHAEQ